MQPMSRAVVIGIKVLLALVAGGVLMLLWLVGSFFFPSLQAGEIDCSPWVETFFRKPFKVQEAEFVDYEVTTQYEIYLCGNQVIHPPIRYVDLFARQGEKAVGFLKTKLAQATHDLTIRDIVNVFHRMQRQKTYAVAHDRELMDLMTASVRKIKDDGWRDTSEKMLAEITKANEK